MKAVLISIQPKWCEKIASGEKTVEIRKTKPKLETPFKCYIYMTTGDASIPDGHGMIHHHSGGKCVIGEFVCNRIDEFSRRITTFENTRCGSFVPKEELAKTCLEVVTINDYLKGSPGYFWHISDLKIYRAPKSLRCFRNPCAEYEKDDPRCGNCDYYHSMGEYPAECVCDGAKPVARPPQSWFYVEEIK